MAKKNDTNKIVGAVATGAGAGLGYSYYKPGLPQRTRITAEAKKKFISKLKPGDVLIEGDYKTDSWSKGLQTFIGRNKPEYHSSVYSGNGEFAELLIKDTKPTTATIHKDLPYALRHGSHVAYRPKLSPREQKAIEGRINAEFPKMHYSDTDAIRVWAQRKVGLKNVPCKGEFCSNAVAKVLPKRLFKGQHPSTVLPHDFAKNTNFKHVATLRPYVIHMPASNKSLLKYVALPALAAGTVAAGTMTIKDKIMEKKAMLEKLAINSEPYMRLAVRLRHMYGGNDPKKHIQMAKSIYKALGKNKNRTDILQRSLEKAPGPIGRYAQGKVGPYSPFRNSNAYLNKTKKARAILEKSAG